MGPEDLPTYSDLILPVLRAADFLGGSAKSGRSSSGCFLISPPSDEELAVTRL